MFKQRSTPRRNDTESVSIDLHELWDLRGRVAAIGKSLAMVEFKLDGTVITANEKFLKATGYLLGEIQGKHHRMFVDPAEREQPAYAAFWESLRAGEYNAGQYRRIRKDGREVWLQATYNPILDGKGQPLKIVKYCCDITEQIREAARSATAAKEIKALITDTVAKVDDGSKLVRQSGESLVQIVATVRKVTDIVAEIATASAEQSRGIEQIGQAVTQMDQMTQQNAAMVEQAAAASQAIADQARTLEAACANQVVQSPGRDGSRQRHSARVV